MDVTETLKEYLDSSSEEIKILIASPTYNRKVSELGTKYGLGAQTQVALENETLFVLLGMETQQNFTRNLISAGIEKGVAKNLNTEVSAIIFSSVQQFLPVEERVKNNPDNLPAIEINEVAHDTTPEEKVFMDTTPPKVVPINVPPVMDTAHTTPQTHYSGGVDPYREPME